MRVGLAPGELVDRVEPADEIAIARLDDDPHTGRDGAQGAEVGVVHVGVREQDHVEPRQLALAERGLDQPAGPQLHHPAPEADAALEHRIGDDRRAQDS